MSREDHINMLYGSMLEKTNRIHDVIELVQASDNSYEYKAGYIAGYEIDKLITSLDKDYKTLIKLLENK